MVLEQIIRIHSYIGYLRIRRRSADWILWRGGEMIGLLELLCKLNPDIGTVRSLNTLMRKHEIHHGT